MPDLPTPPLPLLITGVAGHNTAFREGYRFFSYGDAILIV